MRKDHGGSKLRGHLAISGDHCRKNLHRETNLFVKYRASSMTIVHLPINNVLMIPIVTSTVSMVDPPQPQNGSTQATLVMQLDNKLRPYRAQADPQNLYWIVAMADTFRAVT